MKNLDYRTRVGSAPMSPRTRQLLEEIDNKMIKEEKISFTNKKCNTNSETCKRLASAYDEIVLKKKYSNVINTQDIADNSDGVCAMKMEINERGKPIISFNLNGEGSFICEKTPAILLDEIAKEESILNKKYKEHRRNRIESSPETEEEKKKVAEGSRQNAKLEYMV